MNDDLQRRLSVLESMIDTQEASLINGYMYGLMNGMILSHSVLTGDSPKFRSQPKEKYNKIRHKSIRNK